EATCPRRELGAGHALVAARDRRRIGLVGGQVRQPSGVRDQSHVGQPIRATRPRNRGCSLKMFGGVAQTSSKNDRSWRRCRRGMTEKAAEVLKLFASASIPPLRS